MLIQKPISDALCVCGHKSALFASCTTRFSSNTLLVITALLKVRENRKWCQIEGFDQLYGTEWLLILLLTAAHISSKIKLKGCYSYHIKVAEITSHDWAGDKRKTSWDTFDSSWDTYESCIMLLNPSTDTNWLIPQNHSNSKLPSTLQAAYNLLSRTGLLHKPHTVKHTLQQLVAVHSLIFSSTLSAYNDARHTFSF